MGKVRLKPGLYLVTQGRRVVLILNADSGNAALTQFIAQFPSSGPMGDYQLWTQIDVEETEVI